MSVRLFAAVDLPDDVRAAFAPAIDELRAALRKAGMDDSFRWVAVRNLHLTLRFLGNVEDAVAPRVIDAMQAPIACGPGVIELGGLGTFPPRGRPRVLHTPVTAGLDFLRGVRDAVDARLSPVCSWEPEHRPFAPHLTLARGREPGKINRDEFSRLVRQAGWPARAFEVTHITLFSSRTLPAGPEYTVRARTALRSPG